MAMRIPHQYGLPLVCAITRKVIERHGGTIEVENAPEGLKMQIRLPLGGEKEL